MQYQKQQSIISFFLSFFLFLTLIFIFVIYLSTQYIIHSKKKRKEKEIQYHLKTFATKRRNGVLLDFSQKKSAETTSSTEAPHSPPRRAMTLLSLPSHDDVQPSSQPKPAVPSQQSAHHAAPESIAPPHPQQPSEFIQPPPRSPALIAPPTHRPNLRPAQGRAPENIPPPQSDGTSRAPEFIPPPPMAK